MAPVADSPDLAAISSGLKLGEDQIWYTQSKSSVSFPDAGYSENQNVEESSFWFRHRNLSILELISAFPPPDGGTIFDVGGGNGGVSVALQNAGHRVVLVEPGLPGIINARTRGLKHIVCGTLEQAGFKAGSLDAAGMFDVLEHIEDDRDFLQQLHRLIAAQGRLYLTVPAYQWLWSGEDVYAGHYRRYSSESLANVLEAAGFCVNFSTYIFRWLPLPIYLMRALPYRLAGSGKVPEESDTVSDHLVGHQWISRLINGLFSPELSRIRNRSRIGFGGSILVAASVG